jgi:hypothetical protein
MSRLIDADELLKQINIWCDCVDGACLLKDASTVKAIPLDRIKQAKEEIQKLRGCSCSCSDGIIDDVEDILDKLIESEV